MTFEWMHLRLTLKTVQIKFLAADLLIGSRFPGVLLYFWRKKHQSEEKFFNRLRFTFMFTYFIPLYIAYQNQLNFIYHCTWNVDMWEKQYISSKAIYLSHILSPRDKGSQCTTAVHPTHADKKPHPFNSSGLI